MSGFTALNIEPEDTSEEEIDDTKEIQLEEAFKLYQNALKLQSQGPEYSKDTVEAYEQLFRSEVFKYPEAISDYAHDQLEEAEEPSVSQNDLQTVVLPSATSESSANSLLQLIYLAYKNRGQFVLDEARSRLADGLQSSVVSRSVWRNAADKAIGDYAEALARDDTDIDLWKKAARIAELLASYRLMRFCLESVLAGDDDTGGGIDVSGLDEAFAAGELHEVLKSLDDDLSRRLFPAVRPRKMLAAALKRRNDPYPFLPQRSQAFEYASERRRPINFQPARHTMQPAKPTWTSLAQAILQALRGEQANTIEFGPGGAIKVEVPESLNNTSSLATTGSTRRTAINSDHANRHTPMFQSAQADTTITDEVVGSPEKDSTSPKDQSAVELPVDGTKAAQLAGEISRESLQELGTVAQDTEAANIEKSQSELTATISLPTRKRSSTAAGNEEPEARIKSKRLRARESLVEAGSIEEEPGLSMTQHYQDQLESYSLADRWMFTTVHQILSSVGVDSLGTIDEIKRIFEVDLDADASTASVLPKPGSSDLLLYDLKLALMSWSDDKSQAIVHGHGSQDIGGDKAGLTLFLQHSKTNSESGVQNQAPDADARLFALIKNINSRWSTLHEISTLFLESMLCQDGSQSPSYMREKWSNDLKETIIQILISEDDHLYTGIQQRFGAISEILRNWKRPFLRPDRLLEFVQSVFELHLDIYCSITNPSSQVDSATKTQQLDRLARWADLVTSMFNACIPEKDIANPLLLRFIFASVTYRNKLEEDHHEHVNACLQDLRELLVEADEPMLTLPNNVATPEISTSAIDKEISRLSTLDFFTSVFDNDNTDAVEIIESLEPILEATLSNADDLLVEINDLRSDQAVKREKLVAFLDSGDASLKLFLWKRLQNAYQSISYTPMVIFTQLRALETIVRELESARYSTGSDARRQISLLKWLRDADDLVAKILGKALNEDDAFQCLDEGGLKSAMSVVAHLSRLLYVFTLFDDLVKAGQVPPPTLKSASSTKSFEKSKERFREMQVRSWTLQYLLLKEATTQLPECFESALDDLADYLRSVHNAIGVRQYCRASNRIFLKLAKSELLSIATDEDYSADIAQVLFDLYQLKFASGVGDLDHGCPVETLDKKTAIKLIPLVMLEVNKLNMKDLLKSELRSTLEKMQSSMGSSKSLPPLTHNRRTLSTFLKSPVNPKDLYQSIKGLGDLPIKPVHGETAKIAGHGWYFLLGHLALARFKSVKRVNPTPTDDLDLAGGFLRQDLEHGVEKWETWYRLAQVFEAKIEDDLIWNSTKLNDSRGEIAALERNSIHAFRMAIAVAMRNAEDTPETAQKISDLFSEFACRLYASTREPLNMEAFKTDKSIRHYSRESDQAMYKAPSFKPMQTYHVWRFAAYLLRRKFTTKPKHWTSYYTLGKCLWKMLQFEMKEAGASESFSWRTTTEEVISAFTSAIETLPIKSEKSSDYILEPHFKLVSIVHKMVRRNWISASDGAEILQATMYAHNIHLSEDESGQPEWDSYILAILKRLSTADKSNWHHRIIARAAHVIYDDQQDIPGALGAKHEFTQQIFTKTMTMQVWKPEFERPGRHYVYMCRYVLFFVELLSQLNDRSNLDQLLRRIRRKPADFIDHSKIWESCVVTYVKLMRRVAKIPEGHEKIVFHDALSHDEFAKRSDMMEKWAHEPENTSLLLDILRDAVELKKLNNGLMKGTLIDDLVMDTYASMYEAYVSQLPVEDATPGVEDATKATQDQSTMPPLGGFVTMASLAEATPSADGRMRVGNLLVNTQTDGTSDAPPEPPRPIGLGLQVNPHVMGTPPSSVEAASGPPATAASAATQLPPKPGGRAKNITKAELKRKVDALLIKPPPIKTPVLSKKPIIEYGETPTKDQRSDDNANVNDVGDEPTETIKDEDETVGDSPQASQKGSLHDSADAESGGEDETASVLSEAEEEEPAEPVHEDERQTEDGKETEELKPGSKTMFPGLMARMRGMFGRSKSHDQEDKEESIDVRMTKADAQNGAAGQSPV